MLILGTFLAIGVTGFGAEAFRIALDGPVAGPDAEFVVDRRAYFRDIAAASSGGPLDAGRLGAVGG